MLGQFCRIVEEGLAHLSRSATLHGLGPRPIPSCRLKVLLKNIFKNITFFNLRQEVFN